MTGRVGLQGRMTFSYMAATVVIVAFVELLAGAFVLPRVLTGKDVTIKTLDAADTIAKKVSFSTSDGTLPTSTDMPSAGDALTLIIDTHGRIVATNDPGADPEGADVGHLLPADAVAQLHGSGPPNPKLGASAVAARPEGKVVWAVAPIRTDVSAGQAAVDTEFGKRGEVVGTIGYVYVQTPGITGYVLKDRLPTAAVVLLLTVPVGVLFGLATTGSLRRRLRRLADASSAVAGGDFATRVEAGSEDEVGQLERNFNDMTARLGDAARTATELASQNARLAERTRISRELHDSISQDLFSLALLAGGLERALPPDSPLHAQVTQISETVSTAIHEMRALVLDLHPSALSEKGLFNAIEELCASLHTRQGVHVTADLEVISLDSPTQHAVLRVTQEALANAARHADATHVTVSLRRTGANVELLISDNGHGFDPDGRADTAGVGLRLMRERVGELGGTLTIESTPGQGTKVRGLFAAAPVPVS